MLTDLVERAKNGSREAAGEIAQELYKDVFLFAYSMTGNPHDANDVCQDAFVKAFRNLGSLKDNASFRSWLFKIVSNTAKDHFRRKTYDHESMGNLFDMFTEESIADRLDLMSSLMELSKELRSVLVLRYLNDLDIRETARILSIPANTVKSRTRYALEQMKRKMGGN